ncbi:CHAT domain protein [Pseudogemmobacter humi]|uniref:CHAT domain protein n=1 Tax=Pseudogemmobacter humi TaxID=2483812 RepID=A0A3P5WUL2_9RHOB|nr:CHAT domain protein [Pseudogemmobacter humi]
MHEEARVITAGIVDDANNLAPILRDLRRMLFTVAFDAGSYGLAGRFLELACPPQLSTPPRTDLPPASTEERIRWRSAMARLFEAQENLEAAHAEHLHLGDDYLELSPPDRGLFPVLTNAIGAAYELGDYAVGASLLEHAGRIAKLWPEADIQLQLAIARLYPPLAAAEPEDFAGRIAEALDLARAHEPGMVAPLHRFAALSYLQMEAPWRAVAHLDALPAEAASLREEASDAMVRLQVRIAMDDIDPALAERGLALLGHEAAGYAVWGSLGALTIALMRLGRTGPALLTGVLFVRRIGALIATLPRNPLKARERRRIILSVLEPLRSLLAANDYMQAAGELESLHALLTHGVRLSGDSYRNWAPSPRVGAAAERAAALLGQASEPGDDSDAFRRAILGFDPVPPRPPRPATGAGELAVSFLPDAGRLIRIMHGPQGETAQMLDLPLEDIARRVRQLNSAIRLDTDPVPLRAELGALLFGPVSEAIRDAQRLSIAAFGPLATLPFAALILDSRPLISGRSIVIRTNAERGARDAATPGAALRVLHARGGDGDPLDEPAAEAAAVAACYGDPPLALVPEFDRRDLEAALDARPAVLHIAGHFRLKEDDLASSFLIGSAGEPVPIGAVFAPPRSLAGTELVFLSGCDSAGHGGGRSLAGQLHGLGAGSVIASLWPVDDSAARAVAEDTHAGFAGGLDATEALARAMRRVAALPRFAAPRHWAAFQCYTA